MNPFNPMKYWGWDPNAGRSPKSPNPYLPSHMQEDRTAARKRRKHKVSDDETNKREDGEKTVIEHGFSENSQNETEVVILRCPRCSQRLMFPVDKHLFVDENEKKAVCLVCKYEWRLDSQMNLII